MGNESLKEFCKELAEGRGYSWISKNYHKLDKMDCVNIIKELIYTIHNQCESNIEVEEIFGAAAESILEWDEEI